MRTLGILCVAAAIALLAVGAARLLGRHPHDPPRPPNVVIVLIDTLRQDHTSLGGYERDTTPNLARMAAEGLSLRAHLANAPWTKPSVASIITGLHPSAHGSRMGQFDTLQRIEELRAKGQTPTIEVLSPKLETLAERLGAAGWHTAAFVSNYHLTPKFGYHQGYDDYGFVAGKHDDDGAVKQTLRALREHTGPVFVWCHLMGVHEYEQAPFYARSFHAEHRTPLGDVNRNMPGFRAYKTLEELVDRYDTAVAWTDRRVGRLFDAIRRDEPNTLLIVTSDHGEEFLEHGGLEHASTLYGELLHVPFVAWGPGVPHATVDALTDSLDVVPTLMRAAGLEVPESLPGRALFEAGRLGAGKAEVFAEQHHRGPERRFALIRPGGKLIFSQTKRGGEERSEFYADPFGPEREAWDAPAADRQGFQLRLETLRAAAGAHFEAHVGASVYEELDQRDVDELGKLGYVEGN